MNFSIRTDTSQRRFLSWIWIYFLHFTGLLNWVTRKIATSSGIVVLTFHRVLPSPEFEMTNSPPGMVVRQETFEALLSYLLANCEVLALTGDAPNWESSSKRPRVAITFDDGWKDTSEIASPIARKYSIPISVFVCPGLTGQDSPFWPEQISRAWFKAANSKAASEAFSAVCAEWFAGQKFLPSLGHGLLDLISRLKEISLDQRKAILRRLSAISGCGNCAVPVCLDLEATMSWQEVFDFASEGCSVGSHSDSHQILAGLTLEEVRRELGESKDEIEAMLGRECKMFAYPNGNWTKEVRDLAARLGYAQAFINEPGIWKPDTDPWLIPRVNVWEGSLRSARGRFSVPVFQYTVFWRAYRKAPRKTRA